MWEDNLSLRNSNYYGNAILTLNKDLFCGIVNLKKNDRHACYSRQESKALFHFLNFKPSTSENLNILPAKHGEQSTYQNVMQMFMPFMTRYHDINAPKKDLFYNPGLLDDTFLSRVNNLPKSILNEYKEIIDMFNKSYTVDTRQFMQYYLICY